MAKVAMKGVRETRVPRAVVGGVGAQASSEQPWVNFIWVGERSKLLLDLVVVVLVVNLDRGVCFYGLRGRRRDRNGRGMVSLLKLGVFGCCPGAAHLSVSVSGQPIVNTLRIIQTESSKESVVRCVV